MQQKTPDFSLINRHLNLGECSWTKLDQGLCEQEGNFACYRDFTTSSEAMQIMIFLSDV